MKPATLPEKIVIRRGLYWPGMLLRCYADPARTTPTDLTGWQPAMDAATAPGKVPAFRFACALSGEPGEVQVQPLEGAETLALKVGTYKADLCFLNAAGKPVGPFLRREVLVEDVFTVPA